MSTRRIVRGSMLRQIPGMIYRELERASDASTLTVSALNSTPGWSSAGLSLAAQIGDRLNAALLQVLRNLQAAMRGDFLRRRLDAGSGVARRAQVGALWIRLRFQSGAAARIRFAA